MKPVPPYPFLWPWSLAFWAVYVWAMMPEGRVIMRAGRAQRSGPSQDAGSMGVIVLGMWIGVFVAFGVAWVPRFRFPHAWTFPLYWAGIVLLALGSVLRRHCFRTLGEYFTGNVIVRPDQAVVDRGAYRFVRHPSYTAGMMMFTGTGIALGSWLSTIVAGGSAVLVYIYRVRVEERALVTIIGAPYVQFMKTRKRFIPHVI